MHATLKTRLCHKAFRNCEHLNFSPSLLKLPPIKTRLLQMKEVTKKLNYFKVPFHCTLVLSSAYEWSDFTSV